MQAGTEITLARGQALTDLALRLTPQAVITGRVFDEEREPVAYVQVMAMRYRYDPTWCSALGTARYPTSKGARLAQALRRDRGKSFNVLRRES